VKQDAWFKNKFDEVFAENGRFEKADVTSQNTEYTLTVNTLVDIMTRNIKNTVKNNPWSALYAESLRETNCVPECP
jgi:hypothetical protein